MEIYNAVSIKRPHVNSWVPNHVHDGVIKRKQFRVTDPLWTESTGDRWIPLTKASDAEL